MRWVNALDLEGKVVYFCGVYLAAFPSGGRSSSLLDGNQPKASATGAIVTRGLLAVVLALIALAGLGAFMLREHNYAQAVWLLLFTWAVCVIVYWKPKSVKTFFGCAFGEAILRVVLGFLG
jgi:hypothetical protein